MAHASGMVALEQAVRDELRTLKYHFKTVKQDSKSGPKRCVLRHMPAQSWGVIGSLCVRALSEVHA